MNDQDIIAVAVERARRDTGRPWDMPGIMTGVKAALDLDRGFAATLCACVRAAAQPSNRTPAIFAKPGEHWHTSDAPRSPRRPPTNAEECRAHPGQWRDTCAGCRIDADVERLEDDDETPLDYPSELSGRALYEHEKAKLTNRQETA